MFTGFTPQAVEFLLDIRFNNERSWFNPRKEFYQQEIYKPMCALSEELYEAIRSMRPQYDLIHRTSRIYRDARRLHGGGPYRDHLWLGIEPPHDQWRDIPSLWFSLSGDGWSAGMGYPGSPLTMEKLRARIARDPRPMEKLTRSLNRQSRFILEHEDYKRPRAEAPSRLLAPWFAARRFWIEESGEGDDEILFDRRLVDRLKEDFTYLLPFVDYFMTLSADPEPRA